LTKEEANGLVFFRNAHLVVITTLLHELDQLEDAAKLLDDLEAVVVGKAELD